MQYKLKLTYETSCGDAVGYVITATTLEMLEEKLGQWQIATDLFVCPACCGDGEQEIIGGELGDVIGKKECDTCQGSGNVTIKELEDYEK